MHGNVERLILYTYIFFIDKLSKLKLDKTLYRVNTNLHRPTTFLLKKLESVRLQCVVVTVSHQKAVENI